MIFAGQEQQRLTNGWVAKSISAISASSGCAIEAAPAPQEIVALPPALVRLAAQTAPGGAPLVDPMVTEATSATAAAGATASAAATSGGGAASPLAYASKRSIKPRSANGGAASSTASAIQSASGTPPRKKGGGLPPNVGAAPAPEGMDGLDDDDDDSQQHDDDAADVKAGTATSNGTAEVLKCLYADLYGTTKPTKAQMMVVGERERSSSEVEADAKRVEEELPSATPPAQDF